MIRSRVYLSHAAVPACAILMSLASAMQMQATTRYVDNSGAAKPMCAPSSAAPPYYTDIQAAVVAANAGDQIFVCPGTYTKQVVITKSLKISALTNPSPGTGGNPISYTNLNSQQVLLQPAGTFVAAANLATGESIEAMMLIENVPATSVYGWWFPILSLFPGFPTFPGYQADAVQVTGITVDGSNATQCGSTCEMVGVLIQNVNGASLAYMAVQNIINFSAASGGDGFGIFVQGCGANASPVLTGCKTFKNPSGTQVTIGNSAVNHYSSGGIVANETGTQALLTQNSTHGLGESAAIDQVGIQVGFGAQAQVQNNVSTNHLGPPPHCSLSSSANFTIALSPVQTSVVLQNNISTMAEIGLATTSEKASIQNNVVTDSLCTGIYVDGDYNNISGNTIFNSVPQLPNPASAFPYGVFVDAEVATYGGNRVSGNNINLTEFGVVSYSKTTVESGDTFSNTQVPLYGTFAHAHPKMFR